MDKKNEYKYLQFPLCLIKETYKNVDHGLNLIIRFGIMHYALKIKYNLQDVAVQLMYYYYRKQDVLQKDIFKRLESAADRGDLITDQDYNGFIQGKFEPLEGSGIMELLEANPKLKEGAILNYQLHIATSKGHLNFGIKNNDEIIQSYNEAKKIKENFEDNFGPDSMPSVKTNILLDLRKNTNNIDILRAYIGILSLIGQRNFISTSKPVILSRMIGAKSKDAYTFFSDDPMIQPTIKKYSHRYWMDKLLDTLAQRKFIMCLARKHERKLFVSRYMEPMQLAELLKSRQDKHELKKKQKEALQHLYSTT